MIKCLSYDESREVYRMTMDYLNDVISEGEYFRFIIMVNLYS